jgi:hypothetical protein
VASFDPIKMRRWLDKPLEEVADRVVPPGDVAPNLEAMLGEQFLGGSINAIGFPSHLRLGFRPDDFLPAGDSGVDTHFK